MIPSLVNNCFNEQQVFKLASIETLGFISEEITSKMISPGDVDQILSGLISNIKAENASDELLSLSLKAFLNTVTLASKNFTTPVRLPNFYT